MSRFVNLIRNSLTQPEANGALAESSWSPKGIANSTSFSDFSLGTAGEAESVMTNSPDISPTSSVESSHHYFSRRMSCDYPAAAAGQHKTTAGLFRSSFDGRTNLWPKQQQDHGERNFWASIGEDTLSRSAPAPVKTVAAPVPKPPQSRQRKIDGLDFYEYVELIRSSSL